MPDRWNRSRRSQPISAVRIGVAAHPGRIGGAQTAIACFRVIDPSITPKAKKHLTCKESTGLDWRAQEEGRRFKSEAGDRSSALLNTNATREAKNVGRASRPAAV